MGFNSLLKFGGVFTVSSLLAWPQTAVQPIVLQDVRMIDGTGQPPRDHMQITIEGSKITEIRSALLRIAFPPNAKILNLEGKTVMPGIIDGHGHLGLVKGISVSPENYTPENIESQLNQYERYGVTTMISLGMNKDLLYRLKREQGEGQLGGAAILTADRGLGSPGGMPPVKVGPDQLYRPGTAEEARKDVDEMAERHPDLIKIWVDDSLGKLPKQTPEVYAAAIDETHKKGLRIAAHVYYQADAKGLVEDGVDILAHSIRDEAIDAGTVTAIKSKAVYYIPTLQLEESFYAYADHPAWMDAAFFKSALSPALAAQLASAEYRSKVESDPATAVHKQAFQTAMANLKTLMNAGARISFGTDSGANPYRIQGWAEHRELELMVEAGMTPLQAIQSATAVNAEMLNIGGKTGTIEKGKQADLIVLDADPAVQITNTRGIHMVFHNGKRVGQ
ncbi:MAG: amidohydrolase family protein [Acidobacteriota bacterium]|nr:amidohydrolase family protein [Acidobacteriota bacterium]